MFCLECLLCSELSFNNHFFSYIHYSIVSQLHICLLSRLYSLFDCVSVTHLFAVSSIFIIRLCLSYTSVCCLVSHSSIALLDFFSIYGVCVTLPRVVKKTCPPHCINAPELALSVGPAQSAVS